MENILLFLHILLMFSLNPSFQVENFIVKYT